jgi:hypothetical protein
MQLPLSCELQELEEDRVEAHSACRAILVARMRIGMAESGLVISQHSARNHSEYGLTISENVLCRI